jgi:hypothetical protein
MFGRVDQDLSSDVSESSNLKIAFTVSDPIPSQLLIKTKYVCDLATFVCKQTCRVEVTHETDCIEYVIFSH